MIRDNKQLAQPSDKKVKGVQSIVKTVAYDELTDGGGTDGTLDLDAEIPAGAVVLQTRIAVQTAFDQTTTLAVGTSSDADRYVDAAKDVTSTGEIDVGAPSGQVTHGSAQAPRITVSESSDFSAITQGVATVEIIYIT